MATLSGPQLTQLALQAGFPQADAPTASAVGLAESSGRTDAISPTNDYGVMQINRSAHPELFQQYIWNDPAQNMKMAFIVYQQAGNSFRPWSTFKSGRYRLFLGQTGSANGGGVLTGAGAGGALGTTIADTPAASPLDTTAVTNFIEAASDPLFWTRVAMFVGGVVLFFVGLHGLLKSSTAYQNISKSVVNTAKTAAVIAA
jgi:hypothetical protein